MMTIDELRNNLANSEIESEEFSIMVDLVEDEILQKKLECLYYKLLNDYQLKLIDNYEKDIIIEDYRKSEKAVKYAKVMES